MLWKEMDVRTRWSEVDRRIRDGKGYSLIAIELGTTKNAISGIVSRHGGHPVSRPPGGGEQRRSRKRKKNPLAPRVEKRPPLPNSHPVRVLEHMQKAPKMRRVERADRIAHPPKMKPTPLIGRPANICAFPLWPDELRPTSENVDRLKCCGLPRMENSSMPYCEFHRALAMASA